MKRLDVIGVGPAGADWISPETRSVIDEATDLVGYEPYLERLASNRHRCHASDNREELERAAQALDLAAGDRHVAVVSGGDPGIFAMASAVCEVLDQQPKPEWDLVEFAVYPGISALQAAAARVGAPLGHDFCVLSLSDNLKPWSVIARRIEFAARADLAMAFYNPRSSKRWWQLGEAFDIIRQVQPGHIPVVLARAVGRDDEWIRMTTLAEVDATESDMRTLVLIGNSQSRFFEQGGQQWVYSPRDYR